jgi:hypothetical protein
LTIKNHKTILFTNIEQSAGTEQVERRLVQSGTIETTNVSDVQLGTLGDIIGHTEAREHIQMHTPTEKRPYRPATALSRLHGYLGNLAGRHQVSRRQPRETHGSIHLGTPEGRLYNSLLGLSPEAQARWMAQVKPSSSPNNKVEY